jgi:hypothetical protein
MRTSWISVIGMELRDILLPDARHGFAAIAAGPECRAWQPACKSGNRMWQYGAYLW